MAAVVKPEKAPPAPAPEAPAPVALAPEAAADVIHQIDALVAQQKSGATEWRIAALCSKFRLITPKGGTNRLSTQAVTAYAGVYNAWAKFQSFQAIPFRLARLARKHASEELIAAFLESGEDGIRSLLPRRKQTSWQMVVGAVSRAIARGVTVSRIIEAVDAL
jgi:hypothetical protein